MRAPDGGYALDVARGPWPTSSSRAPSARCGTRSARCPTARTATRSTPTASRRRSTSSVALTVAGDEIIADYAGTSPAQPRAINCVMAYTYAMTAYAVSCALLPSLPNNEGMFRPVDGGGARGLHRSTRSSRPRSVSRAATGHYVPVLVFGALHQVDSRPRHGGGGLAAVGADPVRRARRRQARTPPCSSSTAAWARPRRRTASTCCRGRATSPRPRSRWPSATARSSSTTSACAPGSGGGGQYRGGLGQDILIESRSRERRSR